MTAYPGDWTQGEPAILISRCATCSFAWYLDRQACPRCGGHDLVRDPCSGTGTVFASSTVHRRVVGTGNCDGPLGIALVDLDEGIRVMGRCPPGTPVGQRVVAQFLPVPGGSPSLVLGFQAVLP